MALPDEGLSDPSEGRIFSRDSVGYGGESKYILAWNYQKNRTGSHAAQNLENHSFLMPPGFYLISRKLPKHHFIRNYPINPTNFGERLRKARMDTGLQIKELARMLDVTEATVINWELRGMSPRRLSENS